MAVIAVLLIIGAFGYFVMRLIYLIEAFQQSFAQFLLLLIVPYYSLHFAYVKSAKGMVYRLVLVASLLFQLSALTLRIIMLNDHSA